MNDLPKPCLVDTGRGFSVVYQDRHLYSRYDPKRAPIAAISRITIQPQTLIIVLSPLLGYGLNELFAKLPDNCFVLGFEVDTNLYELSKNHIPEHIQNDHRFALVHQKTVSDLLLWFEKNQTPPVRRCVALEASAGTTLNSVFYRKAVAAMDSFIATWWKNRMTVVLLGRNYHRNILRNISLLSDSIPIPQSSITKPVIVAGAGPSLDDSLSFIQKNRKNLHVLAVDTALAPLTKVGITPDAIVVLESQYWIEHAFHGARSSGIPVYSDLTARHNAIILPGGSISFFCTRFDRSSLLDLLDSKKLLPLEIPRLGSVGLAALYLAKYMTAAQTPIFFTGLDFSWQSGYAHSRGAPWPALAMLASDRTHPAGPAIASPGSYKDRGKNGEQVLTNPALSGYARLCVQAFSNASHCYDLASTGLPTGCPSITHEDAEARIKECSTIAASKEQRQSPYTRETTTAFLHQEYCKIRALRDSLTGEHPVGYGELEKMIRERDYLFSHFADGYQANLLDQSFLNRLRVETEVFLKTISHQSGDNYVSFALSTERKAD